MSASQSPATQIDTRLQAQVQTQAQPSSNPSRKYLEGVTTDRLRTVEDVILRMPRSRSAIVHCPAPEYTPNDEGSSSKVALAVESMRHHMSDEGYQIMQGLEEGGYTLAGYQCCYNSVNVKEIIRHFDPQTMVIQDKREWDLRPVDFREKNAKFRYIEYLKDRPSIFKVTVVKDAQQRPEYHQLSANEMGVHAWIVYYNPLIVSRLAPYIRPRHMIRTWHSIDSRLVPLFLPGSKERQRRKGCLLSGAVGPAYPLRTLLTRRVSQLPDTDLLPHPGYHMRKCHTPGFLTTLSNYKVAICTSSIYGYSLRKIIEATACGCRVVTDLPTDEVLPFIDGNLVRVPSSIGVTAMGRILERLYEDYNPEIQFAYADDAMRWYDYRQVGLRLCQDIETLRKGYHHAV